MKRTMLYEILRKAAPALASKDVIAIFTCFCFSKKQVFAYDDLIAIQYPLVTPIRGGVRGEVLLNWLASLKGELLDIGCDNGELSLKCGRAKLTAPLLPEGDFLFDMPEDGDKFKLPIDNRLVRMLGRATLSMGLDPSHPWRMGITIVGSKKSLILYSCDNISVTRVVGKSLSAKPLCVVVPPRFCDLLKSFAKTEGKGTLILCGEWLKAEFASGLKVFTRAGSTPDVKQYEDLFAKMDGVKLKRFVEIPKTLKRALERARVVLPFSKDPFTSMTIGKGLLNLHTMSDGGEVKDRIKFGEHPTRTIHLMPDLLLRAIEEATTINMSAGFIGLRGPNFSHMIAEVVHGGNSSSNNQSGAKDE